MSNLKEALKAAQKKGLKSFDVTIEVTESYIARVEAIDINSARNMAQDQYTNGELQGSGNISTHIIDVTKLEPTLPKQHQYK